MTPEEQLGALVAADFADQAGEFRPCAIFQERLDCIKVLVRDCSVASTRVNEIVTVLEDLHYKPGQGIERYVGFTLKGVRWFCKKQGISTSEPVKIAHILDEILKEWSGTEIEFAIDGIARRFVDETAVDLTSSNVVLMPKAA